MGWKRAMALLAALLATSLFFSYAGANNFGSRVRWINDYHDRAVYADRGSWWILRQRPYADIPSEYPQVATYLFAVPDLLLSWLAPNHVDPARLIQRAQLPDPRAFIHHPVPDRHYAAVFSILMMGFLWGGVCLVAALRQTRKGVAALLLLPASFYFAFNRFDMVPCTLSLLSLYWLLRRREGPAAVALALGTMAKWYVAILLPIYWAYDRTTGRGRRWLILGVFAVVCGLCLVPTLLSGGLNAVLVPYQFHAGGGVKYESLLHFLDAASGAVFHRAVATPAVLRGFFLLQFAMVPLSVSASIPSQQRLLQWSAVSILVFILFTKFNSPQWLLWFVPLLAIAAQSSADVLRLAALDLLVYLRFPIVWDLTGRESPLFAGLTLLYLACLIGLIIGLLRELLPDHPLLLRLRRIRPKAVPAP